MNLLKPPLTAPARNVAFLEVDTGGHSFSMAMKIGINRPDPSLTITIDWGIQAVILQWLRSRNEGAELSCCDGTTLKASGCKNVYR